ncbi:thyroid transcription factor 1-associated protein 26 homolog isoform X2 [Trichomycterus rosablanca]|uniref:thyroid transcription factor 1-associated protein 26 homolog isoform X2 n=1 Tax=Trichomycterus rosablanca TaxID=2290929 RepID=UPI002F3523EE
MAPVNPKCKGKNMNKNHAKGPPGAGHKNVKNKWNPGNKFFHGSVQEGQGFAFKRKLQTQQQYNKLLRKEKWRKQNSDNQLSETYPEHLKHLYMAEQERLNQEEQMKRDGKGKARKGEAGNKKDQVNSQLYADLCSESMTAEKSSASASSDDAQQTSHTESDQPSQRKWKKMSSYQKMQEEYKRKKEERERKREEYLKDKEQREEALRKYKEKKIASYQLLKKKTKKGQPNLNLQMELLLQKIQAQHK